MGTAEWVLWNQLLEMLWALLDDVPFAKISLAIAVVGTVGGLIWRRLVTRLG